MPPRAPLTDQVIVAVARPNFERRVLINAWQRTADVPGGLGPRGQEDRRAAEGLAPGPVRLPARCWWAVAGRAGLAPGRGGRLRQLRHRAGLVRAGQEAARHRAAVNNRGAGPGLRAGPRRG